MNTNVKLMVVLTKLNHVFLSSLGKNIEDLGMNSSMYAMLAHLNQTGRAKTQKLGETALITSGTITHIVNKMCTLDYTKKVQDKDDKRIYWVEITDDGRRAFNKVNDEHMKYLNDVLSDFSDEEKLEFIENIKYFGKNIQDKCIRIESKSD